MNVHQILSLDQTICYSNRHTLNITHESLIAIVASKQRVISENPAIPPQRFGIGGSRVLLRSVTSRELKKKVNREQICSRPDEGVRVLKTR